jgi:hypothetical protein
MTYRFSWYLAWARPRAGAPAPAATTGARELVPAAVPAGTAKLALRDGTATGAGEEPPFSLDLSRLDWPPAWCRRSPGLAGATAGGQPPCWQTPGVQKTARRLVRQLAGWRRHGRLLVCLPEPGVCLDATHLDRPPQRVLPHWDLPAMLEFAVWARRQLGPGWQLTAGLAPGVWRLLPSLQGAFEVSDSDIGE